MSKVKKAVEVDMKDPSRKKAISYEITKTVPDYENLLLNDMRGPPYIPLNPESLSLTDRDENPVVFLEVWTSGGRYLSSGEQTKPTCLGKLHFELRKDLVPVACANFLSLCEGERGVGKDGVKYHFKGTRIHRIVKDVMFQSGDLLDKAGECSRSIYNNGGYFRDENFVFKHTGAGCISYCNRGVDTNGSVFQVVFCEQPSFDDLYVVFGCCASDESYETLRRINEYGTTHGEPKEEIRIKDCGLSYPIPMEKKLKDIDLSPYG